MSLKTFHIIFIAASTLMALGFGIWCLRSYAVNEDTLYFAGAILSFIASVGLVFYGVWFLRKLKNVSFM